VLLLNSFCLAQQTTTPLTQTVRAEFARREHHRAKLRLRDGSEIKGTISTLTSDSVTLQPDRKSLPGRTVSIDQIASVSGAGLTRGQKWGVFAAVWLGVGVLGASLHH
jgi:hypothetical protein